MRIIRTVRGIQTWRKGDGPQQGTIGFVPTMGALHAGHRSLIQQAHKTCQTVIVSLFVNPLQFGPTEDFTRYPRPLQKDTTFCRREGVDMLFVPPLKEFYPSGFQTSITVSRLAQPWEGERRPTHFQGVATVMTKLLNLIKPDLVFLGQKDYQQTLLIKQLVQDLNLEVKVVMCPTIREPDGLAYSSRNQCLPPLQRQKAVLLYHALQRGEKAIKKGIRSAGKIRQTMLTKIATDRQVTLEYLAICHAVTLEPLRQVKGRVLLLGAIRLGKVRLIDNLLVHVPTRTSRKP